VLPQLAHDGLVVPLAGADEELDRLAGQAGLDGDRLGGLALKAAESAADDQGRGGPLLGAVEPRQVTLEEGRQAVGLALDGVGGDHGVRQECLGLGIVQQ
jgi:hypothetical protein